LEDETSGAGEELEAKSNLLTVCGHGVTFIVSG